MSHDSSFNSRLESIQGDLRRFAYAKFTSDPDKVEDLIQATNLNALRKKHTFDDRRPITPWAFQIMRFAYIDEYRKGSTKTSFVPIEYLPNALTSSLTGGTGGLEDYRLCLTLVRKALPHLQPQYRQVIEALIANADCTFETIANMMNIPFGTFKSHIQKARYELRALGVDLFSEPSPLSL